MLTLPRPNMQNRTKPDKTGHPLKNTRSYSCQIRQFPTRTSSGPTLGRERGRAACPKVELEQDEVGHVDRLVAVEVGPVIVAGVARVPAITASQDDEIGRVDEIVVVAISRPH